MNIESCPNPFNEFATINFRTIETAPISLSVYNSTGTRCAALTKGVKPAGDYSFILDGDSLLPGYYFYVLKIGDNIYKGSILHVK